MLKEFLSFGRLPKRSVNTHTFTLKVATEISAEILENFQHCTLLNHESRGCTESNIVHQY
jgi:hypothetical protein